MKNLLKGLIILVAFTITSCGGDECRTCKGSIIDDAVDATLCDNGDGTFTQTDNLNGDILIDSITTTFAAEIEEAETAGLNCN